MKLRQIVNKDRLFNILLVYCFIFFFVYTEFAYYQHTNLKTSLFDMGLQEHVIRQTAQWNFFSSGVETANYLGDHFSLIIIPLSLIYKFAGYSLTLFSVQTLSVTLSIIAIYKIAKHYLKTPWLPLLIAVLFSWYWGISGLLLFDLHVEGLALPLLLWGIYMMISGNTKKSFMLFILAMVCKEDVGIFVGMLGVYNLLRKNYKFGFILVFIGFCFSFIVIFKVIPAIRGEDLDTMARYSYLGSTPADMLQNLFTKPDLLIEHLLKIIKVKYLLKLFLPVSAVFVLSPFTAIIFLPNLLVNLLADYPAQTSALYQYDIMTSTGIFFATIVGISKLEKFRIGKLSSKNIILLFSIILCAGNILFIAKHPLLDRIRHFENRKNDYQSVLHAKELIPDNAVLATSNSLGPHFVHIDKLLLFDPPWIDYHISPEYIIIDRQQCCTEVNNSLITSGRLEKIFEENNIIVYRHLK